MIIITTTTTMEIMIVVTVIMVMIMNDGFLWLYEFVFCNTDFFNIYGIAISKKVNKI